MPDAASYDEIRLSTFDWIRSAGSIARDRFGKAVMTRKADHSPVTDADHAVQAALLQSISERYPDDAVIAEEDLANPEQHRAIEKTDRCWIVDPIDGTRNYAHGYPSFSVSVALMEAGQPVVGCVYNPLTDEMYSAALGAGAYLEGKKLAVRDEGLDGEVFMALPSSRRHKFPAVVHGWVDRMVTRASGSTALNLAHLASGAVNGVYCNYCKLWDIAAGVLLVTEGGGRLVSLEGEAYFPLALASYHDDPMPFLAAGRETLDALMAEYLPE